MSSRHRPVAAGPRRRARLNALNAARFFYQQGRLLRKMVASGAIQVRPKETGGEAVHRGDS